MKFALGDQEPVLEGSEHFIAPGARLIGRVRLKSHSSVWFNVVVRGDNDWIEIGERSNIQDGSVLHTDPGLPLTVGSDVTVGHKVMLHGCTIGAPARILRQLDPEEIAQLNQGAEHYVANAARYREHLQELG